MLTACGIETEHDIKEGEISNAVATVLTACGIETALRTRTENASDEVATVLTACGIETSYTLSSRLLSNGSCNSAYRLRY